MHEVATNVNRSAKVLIIELAAASIIASFEKKATMYGVPISAREPIVIQVEVIGRALNRPPIRRIS